MAPDPRVMRYFFHYVAFLLYLSVGAATLPHLDWYRSLTLPAMALSPAIVSTAWLAVFLSTAVSLSAVWEARQQAGPHRVSIMYAALLLLVVLWNYLFFGARLLDAATYVSFAITALLIGIAVVVRPISRTAAMSLVPFLAWMAYASYFTHALSVLNP
jgi:translocator protein